MYIDFIKAEIVSTQLLDHKQITAKGALATFALNEQAESGHQMLGIVTAGCLKAITSN